MNHAEKITSRIIRFMKLKIMEGKIKNQKAFAKKIGKSETIIVGWKNGTRTPTIEDLGIICEVFNVSADIFVRGKEQKDEMKELKKRLERLEELV
jgi:transcriptional regulator with XRE-family HTH domain